MLVAGRLPILQRVSNCCWHSDRPFRRTVLNLPSVSLSKAYPSTPYIHRIYHRRKLQKQFYRSVKIYPQYILQFLALLSVAYSIECLSLIYFSQIAFILTQKMRTSRNIPYRSRGGQEKIILNFHSRLSEPEKETQTTQFQRAEHFNRPTSEQDKTLRPFFEVNYNSLTILTKPYQYKQTKQNN